MSRFTLLGVGAGAQNRTEAIGLQVRCSTFELRRLLMLCSRVFVVPEAGIEPATQVSTTELLRQNWRKMMESNHQPSLAGTAFKAACAPCAPSSVVGAAGIEVRTDALI